MTINNPLPLHGFRILTYCLATALNDPRRRRMTQQEQDTILGTSNDHDDKVDYGAVVAIGRSLRVSPVDE
jgi:hypothetical protein